jgi:glycerol-3-phosphate dehydrogenase (NAD(P)+)
LITRGLYELSKLGSFMGSNLKTISGVAGMGDLITTCISKNSRNRMVGERLAKGESIMKIMESMHMVAEGINTTKAVHSIALDEKIDLPITEAVYSIIYRGSDPHEAVKKLMARKFKSEV